MKIYKRVMMYLLATGMVAIGVSHISTPQPFVDIVPAFLPYRLGLVYISGAAEIAGGVGLLVPATRRQAAWGLVALYVAVFPANINMAVNSITPSGSEPIPTEALWLRLPLQFVFITWAWWYTRPAAPSSD